MKSEVKKIERPKIKDCFEESTSVSDIQRAFTDNPGLYNYIQTLDQYCDQIEQELQALKDAANEYFNKKSHYRKWINSASSFEKRKKQEHLNVRDKAYNKLQALIK